MNQLTLLQVLNLDGNYIKELVKGAFSSVGLVNLQKISLRHCQIQTIHEDAFAKLNILTEINLEGNNLTKLQQKTFDGNNRLQSLILARNQLTVLKVERKGGVYVFSRGIYSTHF